MFKKVKLEFINDPGTEHIPNYKIPLRNIEKFYSMIPFTNFPLTSAR